MYACVCVRVSVHVCAPNVSCLVLWLISIVAAFRRNRHVYWLEFIGSTQGSKFIHLYLDMKFSDLEYFCLACSGTVG